MSKARLTLHARSLKCMAGRVAAGVMCREEAISALNRMMEVFPDRHFDTGRRMADEILAPVFSARDFAPIIWARGPVVVDRYVHTDGDRRMDHEANRFAAAFLMPEDSFRSAWYARGGDLPSIAMEFGVPTDIATARASALGLTTNRTTV